MDTFKGYISDGLPLVLGSAEGLSSVCLLQKMTISLKNLLLNGICYSYVLKMYKLLMTRNFFFSKLKYFSLQHVILRCKVQ